MVSCEEMVALFQEWKENVAEAVSMRNANELCESTRMMLALAMILRAYFPETLTHEQLSQMKSLFSEAVGTVKDLVSEGTDPDGCLDLYYRNVQERRAKFEELGQTWWRVTART